MIEKNQPVNFWFGVVTVIDDDPEKLGRVRVRVMGKHHHDPNILKDEDLPLAQMLLPPIYASLSGVGHTPTGLLPGSWVMGFYLDPEIENMPVILGTLPFMQFPEDNQKEVKDKSAKDGDHEDLIFGIKRNEKKGWKNQANNYRLCDPNEIYPTYTSQIPDGTRINAADPNSKIQQSFEYAEHDFRNRKDSLLVACNPADVKTPKIEAQTVREPFMADPEYMFNHVYESQSGHVKEFDDTPKKERIYEQHKSGTFREFQHDGTQVTKVYGPDFDLCLDGKTIVVNSGPSGKSALTLIVNGNIFLNTSGNVTERIYGNFHQIVHGTYTLEVKKGVKIESWCGDVDIITHNEKDINLIANGDINLKSDCYINVEASNTITLKSDDMVVVDKDLFVDNNFKITGAFDAASGVSSYGYAVLVSPFPKPVSVGGGGSCNPDNKLFPYNQCPLIGWSRKKSQTSSSTSGWDYHEPSKYETIDRKAYILNNFSPISSVSKNSYQGNDGPCGAKCTNFVTFDYFKFSYRHDRKFEWFDKPYKNAEECGDKGYRFREKLKVGPKSNSFGHVC